MYISQDAVLSPVMHAFSEAGLLLCHFICDYHANKRCTRCSLKANFPSFCCILSYRCPPLDVLLVSNFGGNFRDFLLMSCLLLNRLEKCKTPCVSLLHLYIWVKLDV